ncbi:tyrosine-type recombinase/integrase [Chloroherpeton thalassium]|nr:tyrosine-type recombinase/integrase [Chloroherpeton thalassium]
MFLSEYLKDKSEETCGTYQRALREFQRYYTVAHSWFRFRTQDIEQYKLYLSQYKKLSQVSVSTYLTSIRRLLDYLVAKGKLATNPAKKVKGNRRPTAHTAGTLSEAEAEKLLNVLATEKPQDHRDLITIRLMLECAASEHELVKANVMDFQKSAGGYRLFVQGKGKKSKSEIVEMPAALGQEIERYLLRRENVTQSSPLLASHSRRVSNQRMTTRAMRYRIKHWLEVAGVLRDNITANSLRHTAAKLWLERDKLSLEEIQRKMRHGMISTTQIYAKNQG